jgi:3-methyladenine DNA glycosylase AlkD
MTPQQLITELQTYCSNNANEANVIKYSRYFKDGLFNAWGLSQPQMDLKTKGLLKSPELSLQLVIDAGPELMKTGKYEEISFVLLLLRGLHKYYTRETFKTIETWFAFSIHNWAHADMLGMQILSVFLKNDLITLNDFKPWLSAENKFQRRSVPVTLIKLLKTYDHYSGLFDLIECLMTDPEREVHQGTGWFLREAWKKKPEETEMFLLKWKNSSPRLIFQYATEKMTAIQKQRFRKEKK